MGFEWELVLEWDFVLSAYDRTVVGAKEEDEVIEGRTRSRTEDTGERG